MKVSLKRKINNGVVSIELEERDEKVAIGKAITLSVEDYCTNCKSTSIVWAQNKATSEKGDFLYIKRRCIKCGATSTLGEYNGGLGWFWKPFEIWNKDGVGSKNEIRDNQKDDVADELMGVPF